VAATAERELSHEERVRLAFVIGGCAPAAAGLVLIGFLHSLAAVGLAAGGFFASYFVAYEPYRAMYPDMVKSAEVAGRAQSAQAVARGLGTGLALVGSGLLLSVARAGPFVLAAAVLVGLGLLVPVFTTARPAVNAATLPIALGGGTLMTLAYAILMPLMPEREHGGLTGFYSLSRGVGIITGPLLAGVLIYLTRHGPFSATQGYQAMWIVCAAVALASLWFVRGVRRAVKDRRQLREL
jgi:Na+/melibiose symporter-like transporter